MPAMSSAGGRSEAATAGRRRSTGAEGPRGMTTAARASKDATAATPRGIAAAPGPDPGARAARALDAAQRRAVARLQRLADELARVPRRAAVEAEAAVRRARGAARRLPLGRRRPGQELPDGRVLRGGADPPQDARPLPRLHARRPRGARHAEARDRSAGDRRAAHRAQVAPRLLRRVPRLGHRRRDDPRAAAVGAVRARRRLRDDVELPAGGAVSERAAAPELRCRRSRCCARQLDVLEVDGGVDYRLRALERVQTYHCPASPAADAAMAATFEAMRTGPDEPAQLAIEGRTLHAMRRAGSAVWFDFAALCDGPRSQRDYLELARRFSVLLLAERAADERRDGRPRAALHLARRHPVRSSRQARRVRGGAARRALRRRARTATNSRARRAASPKCRPTTTWRCPTSPVQLPPVRSAVHFRRSATG